MNSEGSEHPTTRKVSDAAPLLAVWAGRAATHNGGNRARPRRLLREVSLSAVFMR